MAENFVILKELSVIHPALTEGMMKAVGFRNIAVHSYQAIDWKIVFQICSNHLGDFRQFAQSITHRLQSS